MLMMLSAATVASAASVTFTDVSGHWAWTNGQISYLVEKGVINGYKENNGTSTFRPDVAVTRAEFIKMLDETFGLTKEAAISFSDVKSSDWFYKYYLRAKAQGYLLNYGTNANPDGYITREEATALLVRYLDLPTNQKASASTFTDYSKVTSYYKDYILMAVSAGIINGYKEDNGTYTFRPQNTLTRAEALTVLYRAAGSIINANTTSRDTGAAATNNVITKGDGLVVQNITFKGRNIVTEGATSGSITFSGCKFEDTLYIRGTADVTFDNCKVKEVVALGGGKITLSNKTTIESMKLETKTALTGYAGTTITKLYVNSKAANSTHSGSGNITHAVVKASGFKSTALPASFEIGSGLSASFGGATYTGTSTAGDVFDIYPFATLNNDYHYINLISTESGSVSYYFTNDDALPSASDFDAKHAESDYAGGFDVVRGKYTSGKTYTNAAVKKYSYIVLQLQVDNEIYSPVIISNNVAYDAGFKTAPHVDPENSMKITLQTSITGTLYWFYTNEGNSFTQMQFLEEYENTEAALRGEQTLTANKTVSCTLEEKYTKNYDYVAFMYQSASGLYYLPVIVTVGDNGFISTPEIADLGIITYKTSINGTLYFYYSDTDVLPTAKNFLTEYNAAALRKSVEVKKNVTGEIKYDISQIEDYPYMIFAVRTASGDFLAPFALSIDLTTGFRKLPTAVEGEYVTFKTEETGTIKWYYTNNGDSVKMEDFNEAYELAIPKVTSGTVKVTANVTSEINFNDSAASYKYIVLMLIDESGKEYFPVVVEIGISSVGGFKTTPFINGNSVYGEVDTAGEVWYYFTTSGSSISVSTFNSTWAGTANGPLKGKLNAEPGTVFSFSLPDLSEIERYKLTHVAIAYYEPTKKKLTTPVVISLQELATSKNSGIEGTHITEADITVTVNEGGTLYYYFTNDSSDVAKNQFLTLQQNTPNSIAGEKDILKNHSYTIEIPSGYKYIVLAVERNVGDLMVPVTLNVSTPTGNGTSDSYGFEYTLADLYAAMSEYKLPITPHVDGVVSIYINFDGTNLPGGNWEVKQNEKFTLDFTAVVSQYFTFSDKIEVSIQLKSSTTTYKALKFDALKIK